MEWRERVSRRTQCVADDAGERAGRRHGVVQVGERQAALIPGVAAHGPDALHAAAHEGARGKGFGARIPVAALGHLRFAGKRSTGGSAFARLDYLTNRAYVGCVRPCRADGRH